MIPISICTIVKNEQKFIEGYLEAIKKAFKDYPYEVVLVDTGSEDNTVSLANRCLDTVYHFEWTGDFSEAKNYAISKANNELILFLDCDEYIEEIDTGCFDKFVRQNEKALGVITLKSYLGKNIGERTAIDELPRVFSKKYYCYREPVHEQITPIVSSKKDDIEYIKIPVLVEHFGYMGDKSTLRGKVERNNAILFRELEKNPEDTYLYYQIGKSYSIIEDYEKAYEFYGKGLEYEIDPRLDYIKEMVIGYGYSMLNTGRTDEALGFENIYEAFKDSIDFVSLMGIIYLRNDMLGNAVERFLDAIDLPYTDSDVASRNVPLYNLGIINEMLGNTEEAKHFYEKCVDFAPAKERLI